MKKLFAMAVPVLPGQTERWVKFTNTIKNEKYSEFKANRDALGVKERTFLQETPAGTFVVLTLEGDNPEAAFKKFGQGKDAFTQWFNKEVKEIHGIDLAQPQTGKLPELVIDSSETKSVPGGRT